MSDAQLRGDFFRKLFTLCRTHEDQVAELLRWHEFVPTFALGAGFRFWTKISVKETFFLDDTRHTEFKTEV